jgi:hypothetical protein
MGIQLGFLGLLVGIGVASTRLIYHDGLTRQFHRMGRHCQMLAVLIVVTSLYSASIGFSIHEQCMREIKQKDAQIKAIANQKFSEDVYRGSDVVLTTVGGNKISIGASDGVRTGTEYFGCCSSELRRCDGFEGSEYRRGSADRYAGDGSTGPDHDGLLVGSKLLGELRGRIDGFFSGGEQIATDERAVNF